MFKNAILTLFTIFIISVGSLFGATGVVKGVVISSNTRTPIPDAYIAIPGAQCVALSNLNGEFELSDTPLGYVTLIVQAVGYKEYTSESFMVTAAVTKNIEVVLVEDGVRAEEIVVRSSRFIESSESPISARRLGIEEIEKTPGASRDVSKAVQSMPGVIGTNASRNDLLVRGGSSNENRYVLDGIEIPVLNHFAIQGGSGGNASLVNTDFLRGADFYSSAFPSVYSNGVSSVLDLKTKDGNSEQFRAKATVGASDLGVSIDTPISKDGSTTLLASYRRSYLQMLFSMLGLPFLPTYNDAQFKLTKKFDNRSELFLMGLGSLDKNVLNTGIKDPTEYQNYLLGYIPENEQNSYVVGAGYRKLTTSGSYEVTLSHNRFSNIFEKWEENDPSLSKIIDYNSTESDTRLRSVYKHRFGDGFSLQSGGGLSVGQYSNTTYRVADYDGVSGYQDYSSNLSFLRYEFFSSLAKSFAEERLNLSFGVRFDGNTYSNTMSNPLDQFSPRLAVSYDLSSKWRISGSVGRYFQEPTYTTLGYKNSDGVLENRDNGVKYISANHYVLGVTFAPNVLSRLSVEGFYKQYGNYPVSLLDSTVLSTYDTSDYTIGDVPVKSSGTGRAYGVEVAYSMSEIKNTMLNVAYTLLYSQYNKLDDNLEPIKGEYVRSSWDVRHLFYITAIHNFSNGWDLGAKWRFTGGFPYTPYDLELSSNIAAWDAQLRPYEDYSQINQEQYSPYHQLDLRVDKTWFFKKWTLGLYIDIQNIYNSVVESQSVITPEVDSNNVPIVDPEDPTKYLMKSISGSSGGSVLPTFGIIIEF